MFRLPRNPLVAVLLVFFWWPLAALIWCLTAWMFVPRRYRR
jgi:hypothetical protein